MMNMPSISILNERLPEKSMLTAIEYVKGRQWVGKTKRTLALFLCQCGQKKKLPVTKILNGHQISCGCMHKNHRVPNKKYTPYYEKLRNVYYSMINRCHSENDTAYKYYGERGVRVCKEWREDGQKFFNWAINNGWKQGLQLDKDIIPLKLGIPAKLYSPKMCCFVTREENLKAQVRSVRVLYKGEFLIAMHLCAKIGCSFGFLRRRLNVGMSGEDIEIEYNRLRNTNRRFLKGKKKD